MVHTSAARSQPSSSCAGVEDDWNQIQEIAHGMLVSQGFIVKAPGDVGAYASQAKNTLGQYKFVPQMHTHPAAAGDVVAITHICGRERLSAPVDPSPKFSRPPRTNTQL